MSENAEDMMAEPGPGHAAEQDRRTGRRHVSVLRVAKLIRDHGDELGVIRNISPGGVMAHLYSPATEGERLAVEFKAGHQLWGSVRWVRGEDAGIAFDQAIDVERVLAGEEEIDEGFVPRAPRLDVGLPATMRTGIRIHPVLVCDIAQGGLKIRTIDGLSVGTAVVIRIAGLPPLAGELRWIEGENAGIAFDRALPLAVLARWAAETERPR